MEKLKGLNSLNTLNTLGNKSQEITTEELLQLAQMQGGKVAQIANELSGQGNRNILSTIGQGLKNTFNGFVEAISVPGQIVAGMISPNFTIEEAIKENKRVSDVIFGDTNLFNKGSGKITTMQKIGDFIVRLPVDILTDPLTYVTFGASRTTGLLGKMGFGSNSKISLQTQSAFKLGEVVNEGDVISRALNDTGQELFTFGKKIENTLKSGKEVSEELRSEFIQKGINKEVLDMVETEIGSHKLIKATLEKPFDPDITKQVLSNMFEKNPQLVNDFIDKGGLKFFGKTILEGQRIGALTKVIPGMKLLDNATQPFRSSVQALFDPAMIKTDTGYVRLPEEFIQARSKLQSLGEARNIDYLRNLDNIQKEFNLNKNELDILTNSLSTSTLPSDFRLQSAYYRMNGIREDMITMLQDAGVPTSVMDNWLGLIAVPNDTKSIRRGNSMFAKEVGAMKETQQFKAIPLAEKGAIQQMPEVQKVLSELGEQTELSKIISEARSVEDVTTAIGKERDNLYKKLKSEKLSDEDIFKNAEYSKLNELQNLTKDLATKGTLVGVKETAKLQGATDELIGLIGDDENLLNYLVDPENSNKIYKRVATTAKELKDHGIDGFDDNLLSAWTIRGMANIRQALGQEFAEGLVRNFGKWSDEAPDTWQTMSSALVGEDVKRIAKALIRSDGTEMKFHPTIVKAFDDMIMGLGGGDEITQEFLRGYDKLQSYYKSYLTTMFPMFHGRNAISNVMLNFLDIGMKSLDPKTHFMAVDLIKKDRQVNSLMRAMQGTGDEAVKATEEYNKLLSTKMVTDNVGHEWTFGELRSVIRDNNVAFNPNLTGALDVRNSPTELAKYYSMTQKERMLQSINPFNSDKFFATKAGREVGRNIEEQSRLINFMTNLIDTGDVTHATARTKQFLFDYQFGLSKFEKDVMRRFIPFYSFTRFNLELQAKMLLSAPGKIATEIKAVKSLGSLLGGEEMTEEERSLLPKWLSNNLNIKRKKEDGTYEIITGFGTPIEQPFQALSASGFLGSISPLIKIPLEQTTGYNLFQGKPTSDIIYAKDFRGAPKALKDFIGYIEYEGTRSDGTKYQTQVSLRPERMQLILSLPYSRFVTTISSVTDADVSESARILNSITGVKAISYDEELLQQRKDREMIQSIEKMLQNAGIRGEFKRGYTRQGTEIIEQ